MSKLLVPGPKHTPRPELPGVPIRCPTSVKAAGLRIWNPFPLSMVQGTPGTRSGRSLAVLVAMPERPPGRLGILPLIMFGVSDEPELIVTIVAYSQPPSAARAQAFEVFKVGR